MRPWHTGHDSWSQPDDNAAEHFIGPGALRRGDRYRSHGFYRRAEGQHSAGPRNRLSARRDDEEELDVSRFPYARILGKLMFLAGMIRPDLSHSVRELGRRTSSPCMSHWRGLQHVLRYLAGTTSVGIEYNRCPSRRCMPDCRVLGFRLGRRHREPKECHWVSFAC